MEMSSELVPDPVCSGHNARRRALVAQHVRFRRLVWVEGEPAGRDPRPAAGRNLHHTSQDTMEHISAQSLQIVGDVALRLVTR